MAYDIGPRITIDGEAQFNAAVRLMEKNLAGLAAEMNLTTVQFARNDKSVASLTAQNQMLNKQVDEQNKKIPLLSSQYEKQSGKLAALAGALATAQEQYGENSKEAAKAQVAYDKQSAVVVDLKTRITQTNATISEMTRTIGENTSAIEKQNARFVLASATMDDYAKGAEKTGKAFSVLSAAIAAGAAGSAKAAIEWESAFAGVRKTVDASEAEYAKLADSIRQMSKEIPVAATEITKIAENAGQLGIKTENIVGFTRAMADLGVSTNLSGEEAAQAFAKFANITGMAQEDFDRLGSSIVALGNNLATTESDISQMAQRLAAAATQAGFSESEIIGLAGALSSVGLEAEAGGSAFSKAINMMTVSVETGSDDLEAFAEIAGMSADQFAKAYKENAADAVIAFTEGLGNMERHGKSAVVMLEEMGLTEVRLRDSLTRAANAGDLFRNAIEMSNQAWEDNIALTKEAEQRYSTTASQIQIAKNHITDAAITLGEDFLPVIVSAAKGVKDFAGWFADLDDTTKRYILNVIGVTAAIGPLLLAFSKGIKIYSDIKKAMELAETAQKALNVAMASGVWAVAAIGVAAVVGAVITLAQESNKASKEVKAAEAAVKSLSDSMVESNKAYADRKSYIQGETAAAKQHLSVIDELSAKESKSAEDKALLAQYVRELNELMPGLNLQYNAEADALSMTSTAIAEYIDKKLEMLTIQAAEEKILDNMRALIDNETELEKVRAARAEADEALKKAEQALSEAQADTTRTGVEKQKYLMGYNLAVENAGRAVKSLNESEQALVDQGQQLRADTDAVRESTAKLASGFSSTTEEAEAAASAVREVSDAEATATLTAEELDKRLTGLQGSYKTLNGILIDLANEQDVNASQMLDLIRTYPQLAGAISTADGALRLEEQAVRNLIAAQIDAEITTLNAQLAQEQAVIDATKGRIEAMATETGAIEVLSRAYLESATDDAARTAAETNIKRIKAQTLALKAMKDEIGKVTEKVTKTPPPTTTKDPQVEAYKSALAEIEHLRKIGQISDAEYYDALAKNRDEFLKVDSAEWRSATEKLYEFEKQKQQARLAEYAEMNRQLGIQNKYGLIDNETYLSEMERLRDEYFEENSESWIKAGETIGDIQALAVKNSLDRQITWLEDFRDEWKTELDDIMKDYDTMVAKLQGYGELFRIEEDVFILEDLNKQTKVLQDYGKALEALEERQIPEGLMDEILGMDVETGLKYARRLIAMGDTDWKAYISAWEGKQKTAQDIAARFYEDELKALDEKFISKIPDELSWLKEELKDIGIASAEGLGYGFASRADWIAQTFIDVLDRAVAETRAAQGIHSDSTVWKEVGGHMAGGLGTGFIERMDEVNEKIMNSIPTDFNHNSGVQQMGEQMMNGLLAAQSASGGSIVVKVYLDKSGMARDLVDPLAVEIERKG